MQLSLNPGATIAKDLHRRFPQPYLCNARPSLYVVVFTELQKANVVGDDLMPAPSKGCSQCRLAGTGLADKSDKTIRSVDGRRVKRDNSPLMAQHSKRGTEQIGTDLSVVGGRCWVYYDFFAGSHEKSACRWKLQQDILSVVSSGVLSTVER
jgi:hypothetical protein